MCRENSRGSWDTALRRKSLRAVRTGICPGLWTEMDDYKTCLKLLRAGKINVKPMTNRIVSPRSAAEVYQFLNTEKNPPLGVVFDWQQL